MPTWNDHHYARAQEFTRLLAEALAAAKSPQSAAAPALELTGAPFLRTAPTPTAPVPAAPPAPAHTTAATPAAPAPPAPVAPPTAGHTAASVFKKIPWKK
jgi:hypothetical protein